MRNDQRAVVKPAVAPQGRADDQYRSEFAARCNDVSDRCLDRIEQGGLKVQIIKRIGRQAQFGINQKIYPGLVRTSGFRQDCVPVEGNVGGPNLRCAGSDPDKAVLMDVVKRMAGTVHARAASSIIERATAAAADRTLSRPSGPKCSSRAGKMHQPFFLIFSGRSGKARDRQCDIRG